MKAEKRIGTRWFFCLLLIAALLPIACGEKVAPGTAPVKRPVIGGVSIVAVVPRRIDEFTEAAGTVRAARVGTVSSRMMGAVTSLLVKEGDRVAQGQLLLTIDDRDVVQRVKAAEAGSQEASRAFESARQNRGLADVTYGRYKKMYDERAISQQEMDQFAAAKQVAALEEERMREMQKRAAAGLAEAKVTLGFARVTSPFAGQVTEKKIDVGSMAVPGIPLLTVEDTARFNAEISVDEDLAGSIAAGAVVTVAIESLNRQTTGRIAQILPTVDPRSRTFLVKVALSGTGLRSGLYARVRIPRGTAKEAILVPRTAVVERGQLTGVYTVDGRDIVTYRLVRTGKEYGGEMEILSGLKPHDRIIVQGVEKAVDGGILEKGKI